MDKLAAMTLAAEISSRDAGALTRTNIALLTAARAVVGARAGERRATDFYEIAADASVDPAHAIAQITSLAILALGAFDALATIRGETVDATLQRLGIIIA